jgi:hypothetical protein
VFEDLIMTLQSYRLTGHYGLFNQVDQISCAAIKALQHQGDILAIWVKSLCVKNAECTQDPVCA